MLNAYTGWISQIKHCFHTTITHFKLILKWHIANLPIIGRKISPFFKINKRHLTFRFLRYSLSQEPERVFEINLLANPDTESRVRPF